MTDHNDTPGCPGPALERRHPPLPPPTLRGRVLAAVDDMLAGTQPAPVVAAVEGMPWLVAATAVAGLLVAPWLATAARRSPVPERSAIASLAERTLAAGLSADILPPTDSPSSCARLASAPSRVDDVGPAARLPVPFPIRRLLEGEF